jgi:hypothetical protein
MSNQAHLSGALFFPTEADTKSVMSWFENYDVLVENNDATKMIEEAHLPITVITDDSQGNCVAQQWDENAFRASIEGNVSSSDTKIENNRQPLFLNQNLVIVVTESIVTTNGEVQQMRYADVLVKQDGDWKFKCMMQTGWGDMLKEYFGA